METEQTKHRDNERKNFVWTKKKNLNMNDDDDENKNIFFFCVL